MGERNLTIPQPSIKHRKGRGLGYHGAHMHAQLEKLLAFLSEAARTPPGDQDFMHAAGLIERPDFFTLEHLRAQLNSPLLMPQHFALYWQGKRVDCSPALAHKIVQGQDIPFLNKGILEDYLSRGAALVLEGLDIMCPDINELCAAIDAGKPNLFSNAVVFFSQQRGNEAYRGHRDTDDVLVLHLAGQKAWRLYERQAPRWVDLQELPPEKMGRLQAELVINPGDALFIRAGTPHQVQTSGDYSMHLSCDICDRNLNAETCAQLLLDEYKRDSASCYSPASEVVNKLMEHASSEKYRQKLADLQQVHAANYERFRALLGRNKVRALDRWIEGRSALKKAP